MQAPEGLFEELCDEFRIVLGYCKRLNASFAIVNRDTMEQLNRPAFCTGRDVMNAQRIWTVCRKYRRRQWRKPCETKPSGN